MSAPATLLTAAISLFALTFLLEAWADIDDTDWKRNAVAVLAFASVLAALAAVVSFAIQER